MRFNYYKRANASIKKFKAGFKLFKKNYKNNITIYKFKKIIALESTSYPGTTYEELVNKFKSKFSIGKNLFICNSPEREDPGNRQYKTIDVPKVISGHTKIVWKLAKFFIV